jgi:hypothetical protein
LNMSCAMGVRRQSLLYFPTFGAEARLKKKCGDQVDTSTRV